jgi:V-type H+-transporting ATPase subunit C
LLIYRRGNLSQRSLVDVVKKGDLVEDSEFMETLLVAVPKCVKAKRI